jgi:hypothetical protein
LRDVALLPVLELWVPPSPLATVPDPYIVPAHTQDSIMQMLPAGCDALVLLRSGHYVVWMQKMGVWYEVDSVVHATASSLPHTHPKFMRSVKRLTAADWSALNVVPQGAKKSLFVLSAIDALASGCTLYDGADGSVPPVARVVRFVGGQTMQLCATVQRELPRAGGGLVVVRRAGGGGDDVLLQSVRDRVTHLLGDGDEVSPAHLAVSSAAASASTTWDVHMTAASLSWRLAMPH